MPAPLAAVIFDFDGVLANSEPLHLAALRTTLAPRGWDVPPDDYYAHFLGFNDEDALRAMADRYGWAMSPGDMATLVETKLAVTTRLLSEPGVLFPDAASCVTRFARHVPLAIASGAKRDEIEVVLGAHGLAGRFAAIVASGETPRSKPAPDPYARAVQLMQEQGVLPPGPDLARRCVAIEDSRWGLVSARQAGLRCVGITTSYDAGALEDADLIVDRLDELTLEALERLVEARA